MAGQRSQAASRRMLTDPELFRVVRGFQAGWPWAVLKRWRSITAPLPRTRMPYDARQLLVNMLCELAVQGERRVLQLAAQTQWVKSEGAVVSFDMTPVLVGSRRATQSSCFHGSFDVLLTLIARVQHLDPADLYKGQWQWAFKHFAASNEALIAWLGHNVGTVCFPRFVLLDAVLTGQLPLVRQVLSFYTGAVRIGPRFFGAGDLVRDYLET